MGYPTPSKTLFWDIPLISRDKMNTADDRGGTGERAQNGGGAENQGRDGGHTATRPGLKEQGQRTR